MEGIYYIPSKRTGQQLLVHDGIRYFRNRKRDSKQYWKCSFYYKTKCPAFMIVDEIRDCYSLMHEHKHHETNVGYNANKSSRQSRQKTKIIVKNLKKIE